MDIPVPFFVFAATQSMTADADPSSNTVSDIDVVLYISLAF